MKSIRRFGATILALATIISTMTTNIVASAAEETINTESNISVEKMEKLSDGRTATTISFIANSSDGTCKVQIPTNKSSSTITPYMWDNPSIVFSSGNYWGGDRRFTDGNYLGFEVGVEPIGGYPGFNQYVEVGLWTANRANNLGWAYGSTSADSGKADWIRINNSSWYVFHYTSSDVSATHPVKVTVTYYTWN